MIRALASDAQMLRFVLVARRLGEGGISTFTTHSQPKQHLDGTTSTFLMSSWHCKPVVQSKASHPNQAKFPHLEWSRSDVDQSPVTLFSNQTCGEEF